MLTGNTFWTAFATSTAAALVTSLGVYTVRRFSAWGERNSAYFICLAAGVLISASAFTRSSVDSSTRSRPLSAS